MTTKIEKFVSLAVLAEMHGQLGAGAGLSDRVTAWLMSIDYDGYGGFDTVGSMTTGLCSVLGGAELGFVLSLTVSREAALEHALRLALYTIQDSTSLENLYSGSAAMPLSDAYALLN